MVMLLVGECPIVGNQESADPLASDRWPKPSVRCSQEMNGEFPDQARRMEQPFSTLCCDLNSPI